MTNYQRKETFEEVKQRVTREEFVNKLTEVGRENTIEFFRLGLTNFASLVRFYDCENILQEEAKQKRKASYQVKAQEKFNKLCEKASKESLERYYIEENHSLIDTYNYFEVTERECLQLIKYYDLKKPKTLSKVHSFKTKEERYGDANYNNREQAAQTCLEKYTVDNPAKVEQFMKTAYQTKVDKYGLENSNNWIKGHKTRIDTFGSLAESYKITTIHRKETLLEEYGVDNIAKLEETKEKIKSSTRNTFQEKYGVDCYWLLPDAKRSNDSKNSSYNIAFEQLLIANSIDFKREVTIGNFIYDFKVNNYLIEVNPAATHNITWSPYSDKGLDKNYHKNKSDNATKHGYRCIHVWEWDDCNKVIQQLLLPKTKIYARNCILKNVEVHEAAAFINTYHLQGYARDSIRLGLYADNKLVSIMTFGRPRYNLTADYELIRYCSSCTVIGGAEKIFKYFLKTYNPRFVVSYCDTAKFAGNVYSKLGFKHTGITLSHHWFNLKTKQHILDSLLRKRGFDQLFHTDFGKGTSNSVLMIQHGFVEVVDSGQATYMYTHSPIIKIN